MIFLPEGSQNTVVSDNIDSRERVLRVLGEDGIDQFETMLIKCGLDYKISHVKVENPDAKIAKWTIDYNPDVGNAFRVSLK